MLNRKATIIFLTVELIKNTLLFSESHTHSKNKIEVELDLSNYTTKSNLRKRNRCSYIRF